MIKNLIISIFIAGFLLSCSTPPPDERNKMIESITQLEQQCYNEISNTYDHRVALKTLTEYQKFIEKYPNDTTSANYMYLGAQLSKSINLFGESIRKYEVLIKEYPSYKKAANAKFMIGMIYENDIKDTTKAKQAYQAFIDEYPNSELADDAALSIKYMSVSTEDLIKMFEEKNKNKDLTVEK